MIKQSSIFLKLFGFCVLLTLAACRMTDSMDGVYARYQQDQQGTVWDTLVVKKQNGRVAVYRSMRILRLHTGSPRDTVNMAEGCEAVANPDGHTLRVQDNGRLIYFNISRQSLRMGNMVYKKLLP